MTYTITYKVCTKVFLHSHEISVRAATVASSVLAVYPSLQRTIITLPSLPRIQHLLSIAIFLSATNIFLSIKLSKSYIYLTIYLSIAVICTLIDVNSITAPVVLYIFSRFLRQKDSTKPGYSFKESFMISALPILISAFTISILSSDSFWRVSVQNPTEVSENNSSIVTILLDNDFVFCLHIAGDMIQRLLKITKS